MRRTHEHEHGAMGAVWSVGGAHAPLLCVPVERGVHLYSTQKQRGWLSEREAGEYGAATMSGRGLPQICYPYPRITSISCTRGSARHSVVVGARSIPASSPHRTVARWGVSCL